MTVRSDEKEEETVDYIGALEKATAVAD
jgi:hypothetical protein